MAPSAGDGSAPAADSGGLTGLLSGTSDPFNTALFAGGLNMLAGNSNGATLGEGLVNFVNGYGGMLAAQQGQGRQALEDQLLQMKLMGEIQSMQDAQRQRKDMEAYVNSLPPELQALARANTAKAAESALSQQTHRANAAFDAELKRNAGPDLGDVKSIRQEFRKDTGLYSDVSRMFQNALAGAKDPSAAGDRALLSGFTQLLTPGSYLRESAISSTQNGASIIQNLELLLSKFTDSGSLTDEGRRELVRLAKPLHDIVAQDYGQTVQDYHDWATDLGMDLKHFPDKRGAAEEAWKNYNDWLENQAQAQEQAKSGRRGRQGQQNGAIIQDFDPSQMQSLTR
jgi:hypothetical protein